MFGLFKLRQVEAKAMRSSRIRMKSLYLLVPVVLVWSLAGCGEGSKNPAFTEEPEEPVASLKTGPTVLPEQNVCLGGATALAIELDRKPLKAVDIELRTLDFDAAFEVPTSVRVPANEAIKLFIVRAKVDAMVGAQAELSIVPGDRYQVGTASPVTLTVADTALPTITIEGSVDAIISPGSVESYLLQRSDAPQTAISVPLVVEGDADAFSVTPPEVVIAGGENDGVFEIEAIQSKGGATISFLPPLGYCLGDTTSVDVTIE